MSKWNLEKRSLNNLKRMVKVKPKTKCLTSVRLILALPLSLLSIAPFDRSFWPRRRSSSARFNFRPSSTSVFSP